MYLEPVVRAVIGDDIHLAAIPSVNPSAHRDLFQWLGAAIDPRPKDIEARCQQLRTGERNHRTIAEAIMTYVGDRYALDPGQALVDFGRLREIPWLPAEGDAALRGHLPSSLYGTFRKPLFASQARFIDVSLKAQRDSGLSREVAQNARRADAETGRQPPPVERGAPPGCWRRYVDLLESEGLRTLRSMRSCIDSVSSSPTPLPM